MKGWECDAPCLEGTKGLSQEFKVFSRGMECDVGVAAKLRRAVQNAGLSPHEQELNPVGPHRRKDFANRVRGQATLRGAGTRPTAAGFPPSAPPGSGSTILPTRRRRPLRW